VAKFLCTRRLNQDPLENFFGCIRQQGGNCDTPTPLQFKRAFRKLFFDNYLLHTNGNCSADVDAILVGYKTTGKNVPDDIEEEHEVSQPFQVNESDYQLPAAEQNLFMENAITYVTGYLLKKSLQQHQCQICSKELVNNDQLDSSSKLFTYFKAYDNNKGLFGGLKVPTADFVEYIQKIEDLFMQNFPRLMTKNGIGKHLVDLLPRFFAPCCDQFPSEYLVRLFVRMRIHYAVKFGNRDIRNTKRGKNRKFFKVTHL
jgi:hypothetical protein